MAADAAGQPQRHIVMVSESLSSGTSSTLQRHVSPKIIGLAHNSQDVFGRA